MCCQPILRLQLQDILDVHALAEGPSVLYRIRNGLYQSLGVNGTQPG